MTAGESALFDCLPQAWPDPRIQWRRNGQPLDPDEPRLDGSRKYSVSRMARTDFDRAIMQSLDKLETGANENDDKRPSDNQEPIDLFGSRLVIRQVDKNDEGRYSCLVETGGSHRLIERESPAAILLTYGKLTRFTRTRQYTCW